MQVKHFHPINAILAHVRELNPTMSGLLVLKISLLAETLQRLERPLQKAQEAIFARLGVSDEIQKSNGNLQEALLKMPESVGTELIAELNKLGEANVPGADIPVFTNEELAQMNLDATAILYPATMRLLTGAPQVDQDELTIEL